MKNLKYVLEGILDIDDMEEEDILDISLKSALEDDIKIGIQSECPFVKYKYMKIDQLVKLYSIKNGVLTLVKTSNPNEKYVLGPNTLKVLSAAGVTKIKSKADGCLLLYMDKEVDFQSIRCELPSISLQPSSTSDHYSISNLEGVLYGLEADDDIDFIRCNISFKSGNSCVYIDEGSMTFDGQLKFPSVSGHQSRPISFHLRGHKHYRLLDEMISDGYFINENDKLLIPEGDEIDADATRLFEFLKYEPKATIEIMIPRHMRTTPVYNHVTIINSKIIDLKYEKNKGYIVKKLKKSNHYCIYEMA